MRNAALALTAVAAFGCSQPAEGPSTADFNQSREALKARAERKKTSGPGAPAQVARVAPPDAGAHSGNLGGSEAGYVYDETGKRDPFRSFLLDRAEKLAEREVRGPLEQFDLAQLSLEGVVWKTGNARALISDPGGETYIVAEGARIGKNEGRVIAIEDNLVRVKETYIDYLGRETTKDIELRMRRNEGG
jgi:hypothetical protein